MIFELKKVSNLLVTSIYILETSDDLVDFLFPDFIFFTKLSVCLTDSFLAIILPPQTAMLAVGSVKKIPIVSPEENIMISNIMNASLSADHRVTDGAEGAKFLAEIKNNLENPVNLII